MVKSPFLEEIVDRSGLRLFLDQVQKLSRLSVLVFDERGEPVFGTFAEAMGCPTPPCADCPAQGGNRVKSSGVLRCLRGRQFQIHPLTCRGETFGAIIIGPFSLGASDLVAQDRARDPAKDEGQPGVRPRERVGSPVGSDGGDADLGASRAAVAVAADCPVVTGSQLQATIDLIDQFFHSHLETAQERESVRRKEKILSVLEEASKIMTSSLDFQNLLEFLMDIAIDITGATSGALLLKKDKKNYLEVAVARGAHPQEVKKIRVPIGKGITGWVARHQEPLVVPNVLLEPRYIETPETIYSEMAVPLMIGDRLLGVIAVDSNQINAFSKDDAATLTTLASMVTKVLENARLLSSSNQKLKELSHLYAVSELLADESAFETVLVRVLGEAAAAADCQAAALLRFDPDTELLALAAQVGLPGEPVAAPIPLDQGVHGWVARHRQPLLVTDIARDLPYSKYAPLDQVSRSLLVLPLTAADRLHGVLGFYLKRGNQPFSTDDERLLTGIARQLTAHLENRRLFQDSQQRLAHLSTLYEVSECVSQSLNPIRLFNLILQLVTRVMGVETCSLMLYDPVRHYLTLDAAIGIPQAFIGEVKVPVGEGISGWVAQHRQPLLLKDISKDERFRRRSGFDYKTGSALSVPILHHDRLLGVLNVNNKRSGVVFTLDDQRLLTSICEQIAQGMFNAILYERTEQQVAELSLLQELGKAINSTLDLDSVLNYVIDMTSRITEADKSTLMLVDPETQVLYVQVARGFEGEQVNHVRDIRLPVGQGIAGKAARTRRPVRVTNTLEDPDYLPLLNQTDPEAKSLIAAPMLNKDQLIGVINCERVLGRKIPFTPENLDILDTLASQASVAIENARLYDNLLNVYLETIRALAAAIDAKDSYTHGHSKRVTEISVALAQVMGCRRDEIDTIRHAALLHDVGKIGIAEGILLKPGRLTDEEFEKIKSHPMIGAGILDSIEFLKNVCQIIEHHHERFDGKGYPDRLAGENIPLGARIICVADSYDAITSTRPYRQPLSYDEAEEEIRRCSGTQFDPVVVAAFVRLRTSKFCPPWLLRTMQPGLAGDAALRESTPGQTN